MNGDELQGSIGPFKGSVRGPLGVIVIVLLAGFGVLAYQIDKDTQDQHVALATARILQKAEHDTILLSQQAIVRAQEDNTCMLALPPELRPAAVQWTRTGADGVKWRSVCEYVVTVYLQQKRQ